MTLFTFLSSGDFKGNKFAVVGLHDSSACPKILLPCFPSRLISHRHSTKGLCKGKQQTTHAIGFSTELLSNSQRVLKPKDREEKEIN